jgi:predicted lipase
VPSEYFESFPNQSRSIHLNLQAAINSGLFVEFVYNNWNKSGQATDLTGQTVVDHNGNDVIPGTKYAVIKTIYSNDLATDLSPTRPLLEGYKTIGIVAANGNAPHDVYIAIRGTENIWEWLQDLKFLPRSFNNISGAGLTEDGFTDMYLSFSLSPAPTGTFIADLQQLLQPNAMITVCGHSLGAALATLLALEMAVKVNPSVALYTLASPRVGDLQFSHLFNHVVQNAYRIANRMDIVPKTPPPLLYFHVGDETDLIPGKDIHFSIPCEHNIQTYVSLLANLVDPKQTAFAIPDGCSATPAAPTAIRTDV